MFCLMKILKFSSILQPQILFPTIEFKANDKKKHLKIRLKPFFLLKWKKFRQSLLLVLFVLSYLRARIHFIAQFSIFIFSNVFNAFCYRFSMNYLSKFSRNSSGISCNIFSLDCFNRSFKFLCSFITVVLIVLI